MGGYSKQVKEWNMKKFLKMVLLLGVFILASSSGFASCETGFACSISDLETSVKQNDAEAVQKIQSYFNKTINEDFFFNQMNPDLISYNDLFIFNTIV